MGARSAAEAEGVGLFAKCGDAKTDVFFERDAKLFRALDDIFTADAARERFVLHALFHGADLEIENTLRGAHVGACGQKSRQFIAGEKSVFERGLARDTGIVSMRKDGANDLFGIPELAKNPGAFGGMFVVGRVVGVGPAFVVEIVEERGEPPNFLVRSRFASVGAYARFDGEHVFAQTLRLRVFAEKFPGIVASRHEALPMEEVV